MSKTPNRRDGVRCKWLKISIKPTKPGGRKKGRSLDALISSKKAVSALKL
jgi:hypothetical protein